MEKINKIFVNIVTFVLVLLIIFLPLFVLNSPNANEFKPTTIYGFHFLGGLMIKNDSGNSQVLASKLLGFIPVMMLLSSFIIDKLTNVKVGKDVINFLCLFVSFIYMFLLPVFSYNFLNEAYKGHLEFNKIWGYYLITIILGLVMVYYLVNLIINLVKLNKQNNQETK